MTVAETLATMIRNWPTLYETRLDALKRCFTESWGTYQDGCLIPESLHERSAADIMDEEEQVEKGSSKHYQKSNPAKAAAIEASDRLYARRFNAKIAFLKANADLLAIDDRTKFSYPPSFSSYELNRVQLDKLNDEWKAAFVEFCNAILTYDEAQIDRKYSQYSEQARADKKTRLQEAKETAREGLLRAGLGQEHETKARNAVLEKLRYEAARLGFDLTPIKDHRADV